MTRVTLHHWTLRPWGQPTARVSVCISWPLDQARSMAWPQLYKHFTRCRIQNAVLTVGVSRRMYSVQGSFADIRCLDDHVVDRHLLMEPRQRTSQVSHFKNTQMISEKCRIMPIMLTLVRFFFLEHLIERLDS
jgi:hypothetical protein